MKLLLVDDSRWMRPRYENALILVQLPAVVD
jgi:hypothetical protein